jgi:hypothetical protein
MLLLSSGEELIVQIARISAAIKCNAAHVPPTAECSHSVRWRCSAFEPATKGFKIVGLGETG